MKKQILINSLADIDSAAAEFLSGLGGSRVVAFYGSMGAGKTTFITALCKALGVRDDAVSSPTFAIVNEYSLPPVSSGGEDASSLFARSGGSLFHFDFYRIKRLEEVYDMGYEDYFYSGDLCFIEWPELIDELLPDDAVRVTITENSDGSRTVNF